MAYCDRCGRGFRDNRALEQHKQDSSYHWICHDCGLDFSIFTGLDQHYIQSPKHHYCRECQTDYKSEALRLRHMEDDHWYCRLHDRVFKSNHGLQSHYFQNLDHYFCQDLGCMKPFDTYAELQEHDRVVHLSCTDCNRSFQSESNLRHYLNSKVHRPADVRCPGRGCNKSFVSHAALVLHFESDTCSSGMTREQLNRLIVRADTNNYITNPNRLLTGAMGRYEPPTPAVTWATDRSWNGYAYQCFLCNRTFDTLVRLNQHLQSPSHEDKIYRCPKLDCRIEFVTLGGLCQHVERGSCGVRMFRQVHDVMDGLTRGFNTLTM